MFDRMNGIGAHEVIIETPDHDRTLATMSEPEIERVLWAYRERMLDLKQDQRLPLHPGVQEPRRRGGRDARAPALAADRAADRAGLRARGDRRRAAALRGRRSAASSATSCSRSCATAGASIQENADVVALAPYAPRFPFETWLLPKRHGARFEEAPRHEYESLARLLKAVLQRMNRALESPPYNSIAPHRAVLRGGGGRLPLAHRDHAEADARGRLRVGDRLLHQPDVAGGGGAGAAAAVAASA